MKKKNKKCSNNSTLKSVIKYTTIGAIGVVAGAVAVVKCAHGSFGQKPQNFIWDQIKNRSNKQ